MKLKKTLCSLALASGMLLSGQTSAGIIFNGTVNEWSSRHDVPGSFGTIIDGSGDPSGAGDALFTLNASIGDFANNPFVFIEEYEGVAGGEAYSVTITPAYGGKLDNGLLDYSISFNNAVWLDSSFSGDFGSSDTIFFVASTGVAGSSDYAGSFITIPNSKPGIHSLTDSIFVTHSIGSVPEPVSLSLFGIGMVAMAAARRRRRLA